MEPSNAQPTDAGLESTTPAVSGQRVSYWHTALLVVVLLVLSLGNSKSGHGIHSGHAHLRIYLVTIAYEWLLTGYVWWGVRRSGGTLRQLVGGRWDDFGDFLLDVALAGGVWFGA